MAAGNRTALVTGAGTGIGKAAALALLKDGYRVALAGRRKDMLEKTGAEAGANGKRALVVPTDVGKPDQVSGAVRADQGEVRPPRRAVQQRRRQRARRAVRGPAVRASGRRWSTST